MTLFNAYDSPLGRYWYPHILRGVHLETDRGNIIKKYGPEGSDNAVLHIPFSLRDGERMIGDLKWMPPKAWEKQVDDDLPGTVTISTEDFFWVGAWEGDDPVNDEEYADRRNEGFYAYMNANEDYVFRITSVGGPYDLIPHFEILGA